MPFRRPAPLSPKPQEASDMTMTNTFLAISFLLVVAALVVTAMGAM